ncbi:MAG TPA: hypothetical protein VFA04_25360 [Bryobacteraceae bacterium]|nr:hypothetical protein [Bryobacteraceae bacterium]
MKEIWQNQELEGMTMSLEDIRRKAGKLRRRILWRNAREFAAAALVVPVMSYFAWRVATGLTRVAAIVCIAGVLYVVVQLYRRGSARNLPADLAASGWVAFYRRELERQRDLLASVWSWYLAPLIPGLALFIVGGLLQPAAHLRHTGLFIGGYAILAALAFAVIGWLNQHAARRLQRAIDELNALER